MTGKPFRDGPEYIGASAANIYNPASGTYALVRHIRLTNASGSSRTVSLYIGATGGSAGGTEILGTYAIAANDYVDIYFQDLFLASTDFLTGVASAANSVTIVTSGQLFVA